MRFFQLCKPAQILLCAGILVLATACSSSLDPSLDNRSCSADGECVDGYVCSSDRVCVRRSRADATIRVAANGGNDDAAEDSVADAAVSAQSPIEGHSGAGASGSPAMAAASGASAEAPAAAGAAAGAAGAATEPMPMAIASAGSPAPTPAPMPTAGAMSTAGAAGADTAGTAAAGAGAAGAGAPSTPPPAAGRGGMMPLECAPGLDLCGSQCVDLSTDGQHCGACDKHCDAKKICVSGRCEKIEAEDPKAKSAAASKTDVDALAALLALFGFDLSDLADSLDVREDQLASTDIKLDDLEHLGIDEAALGLFGFTIQGLASIGILVSQA
jgi:hypothetical protein